MIVTVDMLKQIEWLFNDEWRYYYCPVCNESKELVSDSYIDPYDPIHKFGCWLGNAIYPFKEGSD